MISEALIIYSIVGTIGLLSTLSVFSYANRNNQRFERRLAAVRYIAPEAFDEIN